MSAEGSVLRIVRDESNLVTFSNADQRVPCPHNRPLYVIACVNRTELKCTFLDGGASINLMQLSTFKKLEILENRIVKSPIMITGFKGEKRQSLGYVVVDLEVGAIRSTTKFHLINADLNYQIILGRSWMHKYAVVPSSYHQCLKGVWVSKEVSVGTSESPFNSHEAHLSDAVYFTEMGEAAQAITSKPHEVKISKWDDIKEEKEGTSVRDPTAAEAATSRKITKVKERGRRYTVYDGPLG